MRLLKRYLAPLSYIKWFYFNYFVVISSKCDVIFEFINIFHKIIVKYVLLSYLFSFVEDRSSATLNYQNGKLATIKLSALVHVVFKV